MKPSKTSLLIAAFIMMTAFTVDDMAQEPRRQEPGAKTQPARAGQKAATAEAEKQADAAQPEASDEVLGRAIKALSAEIGTLTDEVKRLRQANERTSQTLELLLYEERLAKLDAKVEDAIDYKAQLDSREQEIQRRMRSIPQEVSLRGGLRREETENALRAEYQRALEDTRTQQANYQQRIAELQIQADRLRVRVEALRRKLERSDEKTENQ